MGLTVASLQDYDTYKKDLHLTLRSTVISDYTFLTATKNKVLKTYLICGKFHKAIMNALKDQFDSFTINGKGTFENTVFHPVSGTLKVSHLKELGVDKISSIRNKKLNDDDLIPGRKITVASFRLQISSAEALLSEVPFENWKSILESKLDDAKKQLEAFGTETADYDRVDRFIAYVPWFREKLLAGIQLQKQIDELVRLATIQQNDGRVVVGKEKEGKQPNPVVLEKAQSKVERFGQALDKLGTSRKMVERGPDSLTDGARSLEEARDFFTSVTDFSQVHSVKKNDGGVKLKETINETRGLGDLYSTIKQRTLQALKSSAVQDWSRKGNAELLKIVLKDLFAGDLASKLEAVDRSADKPIDARKPYIEKAIITIRQYISKIAELEKGELPVAVLNPLRDALVHIHSELTTLHTSKPLPEKK